MNPTIATVIAVGCALTLGVIVWAIYTAYRRAETRLRQVMATELARIDDTRLATQARSRALDLELIELLTDAEHGNP